MNKRSVKHNKPYYFIYPGDINTKTGGYIYEKNILKRAKKINFNLKAIKLSDSFPFPKKNDLKKLKKILEKLPNNSVLIFDGLVFEAIDSVINDLDKFEIIALIHHPLYLEFEGNRSQIFLKKAKKLYKKTKKIIVTSNNTKKLIFDKFNINQQKIHVVEPGIAKLRKYKFKKEKNLNLLTVGSIIERKNYHYLINELRYMDNIKLNIVGDTTRESKYYKRLLKIISNHKLSDKIKFYNNVSTDLLSKLYSKCDFYVSVSKYEGFGMSLANALQLKKMIITFKTKTIMDTLKKDGIIYLNNFKEKSLSKLIQKNLINLKNSKKLAKNNRKFITPIQSGDLFIKTIRNA